MSKFRPCDYQFFHDKSINKLNGDQFKILVHSILGPQIHLTKGTGIYPISTTHIHYLDHYLVQDQLGRTRHEMAMLLHKDVSSLSDDEIRKGIGLLVKDFPTLIDYDPVDDMIFSKKAFRYSTVHYLKNKALLEGIHSDFVSFFHRTKEDWWGEFMLLNEKNIIPTYRLYESTISEPVKKTFSTLFSLSGQLVKKTTYA